MARERGGGEGEGSWLWRHARTAVAMLVLAAGAVYGVRFILQSRAAGPPVRKGVQFAVVNLQQPKPPPPPPKDQPPPKKLDEPEPDRTNVKPIDLPPDAPPPPPAPAAGPLALAAAGDGPGDAFNLAGNPGGRSLVSGGGIGDGSGGLGDGDPAARYAWFYGRMQPDLQAVLQKSKKLTAASVVAELRIWWDEAGRITRVQPVRASADPSLDEEFQRLVGVRLRYPPPPDVPMPVVMRINARRPS